MCIYIDQHFPHSESVNTLLTAAVYNEDVRKKNSINEIILAPVTQKQEQKQ